MERYKSWLADLEDVVVSPANPLKDTNTVHSDGSVTPGSQSAMSGFTIVNADSIDEAVSIARFCPFLDTGGSLEVSEMVKLKGF